MQRHAPWSAAKPDARHSDIARRFLEWRAERGARLQLERILRDFSMRRYAPAGTDAPRAAEFIPDPENPAP